MPDIGNYTETTRLVLGEAGKYFTLLLFSVLAIRLWRRWAEVPAQTNRKISFWPGAFTLTAAPSDIFQCAKASANFTPITE